MSIRKLWVDMPGEIVRNVDLDIREGEILGIGGLAGQGKLGIPNGVMGLYEAGGTVEFDGKPIPLNAPRRCLDAQLAFVSEDRRGVGLLLDESLEWNIAFPAMQIHNKFLKSLFGGLVKWRDEKAIRAVTDRYIDELKIKCTSSKQKAKELLRRQPAEGLPCQGICARAEVPLCLRADPRHRRRREISRARRAQEIQPRERDHRCDRSHLSWRSCA